MLKELTYKAVELVARMHDQFLMLNDNYSLHLTDKQLHFIIIGLSGILTFILARILCHFVVRRGWAGIVAWTYTFTFVLMFSFAIEIGQYYSGTGRMDMDDVVSGMAGFVVFSLVYAIIGRLIKRMRR